MTTTKQKATRSDKGRIKITPRDWSGLRFVAEMRAVRLDHLGQFFAPGLEPAQVEPRTSPAYPPGEKRQQRPWPHDPVRRAKNTYDIVSRWQRLGLARLEKPFQNDPMWIWVTQAGLTQLELPYSAAFPALGELSHLYQINRTRLTLARSAQTSTTASDPPIPTHNWISERALAAAQEERRAGISVGHRPDGALHLHTGAFEAIEVELTRKSYQRLQRILEELTAPESGYARVWYFVSEATAPALVEARAQLNEDRAARVLIYRL